MYIWRLYKHILPEYCFWKTEQFFRGKYSKQIPFPVDTFRKTL